MALSIYVDNYDLEETLDQQSVGQPTVGQFISCVSVETYINRVLVKLDRSTVSTNNIYSKHYRPLSTL